MVKDFYKKTTSGERSGEYKNDLMSLDFTIMICNDFIIQFSEQLYCKFLNIFLFLKNSFFEDDKF